MNTASELFYSRLQHYAKQYPTREAIILESGILNYAQLWQKITQTISYLSSQGITSQTTLAIHIKDEQEHFIASIATLVMEAGQIALPSSDSLSNHMQTIQELPISHYLSTFPLELGKKIKHIPWPPEQTSTCTVSDFALPTHPNKNNEAKLFLKTSGTSGQANLLCFTESQLIKQAKQHPEYHQERFFRLASIEFNASKRHRLYCLWWGGCNIFRPTSQHNFIPYCLDKNVGCIDISRVHISDLIANPNAGALKGLKLRPGGAVIPYSLRQKLVEKTQAHLYVRYATTESGPIAMAGPQDHNSQESVGAVLPGACVEIVGPNQQRLAAGEIGEIRIKSPGMAVEYYNNPEQSKRRFRDGWFYPGDAGYFNRQTQLVIKGRIDDMMILNGINIFPVEIEKVLEQHPMIKAAAAVAIPSPIHGEIPVAVVELEAEQKLEMTELSRYCKEHLSLRAPRRIIRVDKIPRNSQGKILKNRIIAQIKRPKSI